MKYPWQRLYGLQLSSYYIVLHNIKKTYFVSEQKKLNYKCIQSLFTRVKHLHPQWEVMLHKMNIS